MTDTGAGGAGKAADTSQPGLARVVRGVGAWWSTVAEHGTADALTWRRLRQAVGLVGALLPLVVWTAALLVDGTGPPADSISDYYETGARDVLVGSLAVTGVFLMFYNYRLLDFWLTFLAGVAALVVALVPASGSASTVHFAAASALFLLLALVSLTLFTRGGPDSGLNPRKAVRNRIYRVCGWVILGFLVLAFVATNTTAFEWLPSRLFWIETVMVVAFGFAWAVKGDLFPWWRDDPHATARGAAGSRG